VTGAVQPLGYRRGLDGLRGVAIIAVLGLHGLVPGFGGGWLGVDIFFVLSGFLITVLLLEERATCGSISIGRFYGRRALRLLPSLFLVLTAVAGYTLVRAVGRDLSVSWAPEFSTRTSLSEIAAGLLYAANWRKAVGAGDGLLPHLWSLAIEEQFYLLWPLLLVVILRPVSSARRVMALSLTLLVVSVGVSMALVLAGVSGERISYGTDTRGQGLLVGCFLAAVWRGAWPYAGRFLERWGPGVLAPVAAGFLLWRLGAHTGSGSFESVVALAMIILPGGVVVFTGAIGRGPVARVLSFEPLQVLGRLSYALYLWHWPVFVLLGVTGLVGRAPWWRIAAAIVVSLLAAAATTALVDRPVRNLRRRLRVVRPDEPVLLDEVEPARPTATMRGEVLEMGSDGRTAGSSGLPAGPP